MRKIDLVIHCQTGYNTVTKNEKRIQEFFVMKKKILSAVFGLALVASLSGQALAAESSMVRVGDTPIQMDVAPQIIDGTMFVAYPYVVRALYPDAAITWENGGAMVRDDGLELFLQPGSRYLVCNGRYLYTAEPLFIKGTEVMVPLRLLCQALGAGVEWDASCGVATLTPGSGPILSGDLYYDQDALYWLSRIINAESGNQSLEGKIAVGNVVMNRVESPLFPDTIKGVLYQRNQFSPVQNGSIWLTPNAESVVAAKLVLDGAETAGDSLYFVNPRLAPNSWASRNRAFVATIGAHAFFA